MSSLVLDVPKLCVKAITARFCTFGSVEICLKYSKTCKIVFDRFSQGQNFLLLHRNLLIERIKRLKETMGQK